ncbi:MAG: hypothetical protein AABZ57_02690 [Candidatus Margulisiibacteriota bacterium]
MILEFLDDRKKKVLEIIIEDYINLAEPIASSAVVKKHHVDASPATIRFDMADLEKKGYIKKPHTSAGRIPSDKGYRFFVDNLMQNPRISQKTVKSIKEKFDSIENLEEEILSETVELLSFLCGNASIVVSQGKRKSLHSGGISKMLRQPEFFSSEKSCSVIETIENHPLLTDILDDYTAENDVPIHIGAENEHKALKECSVIARQFGDGGILCVIGPTRMHYEKVSSALDFFSRLLTEMLG